MGRTLRTLFCALLATAVVPSTLRAAYAEVQAVSAIEQKAAPASLDDQAPRSPRIRARSSVLASRSRFTRRFYVRYCRLLR